MSSYLLRSYLPPTLVVGHLYKGTERSKSILCTHYYECTDVRPGHYGFKRFNVYNTKPPNISVDDHIEIREEFMIQFMMSEVPWAELAEIIMDPVINFVSDS